ncbi:DUF5988 family protein [Spongiactinospora sp. TRM90649]|uniref:DUF5988 family protein n=1 Tax=Spongiactinospora sp. TRM90649 TaxID=3031114 RepID=UPI0023F8284B|nr:DUF5988 family protein [Spongiactinospora sp. TRM90649]MDF5757182.1 DUF5988 family protein [Spongiactinospora sp. TRM90649]
MRKTITPTAPAADHAATLAGPVDVVLEGGPAHLPRSLSVEGEAAAYGRLKIANGAGYEHFERVADTDAGHWVFRWIMRTRIAE